MTEVNLAIAFVGGLVSFLAPCFLPVIPGFLSYLAGSSGGQPQANRWSMFWTAFFFVLGFSIVFSSLGVLLNTLLESVAYDVQLWLSRIGGLTIIFFGIYLIGVLPRIGFLERDYKIRVSGEFRSRYITSLVFGFAFAAGWTPCVGLALGPILGLAASQPGTAFYLLLAYSLGLGLPFLVVGIFASQASRAISRYGHIVKYINAVFGLILISLGVLIFTQKLSMIANFNLLIQWFRY